MKTDGNRGLLAALVRNINSRTLNRAMIGFALDEYEGTVDSGKALAYAKATGDDNPGYAGDGALAPPFYLSSLVYDRLKQLFIHRDLNLNLLKMIHGEQEVAWHTPVRIGDRIRIRIFIKDIRDSPAGEILTISTQGLVGNSLAAEALMGFLVRGGGRHRGREIKPSGPEAGQEELFRREIRTWEGQQLSYAAVSGDMNFIHTSRLMARMAGLPRTILHGVCFMAMCCSSLTRHLLGDDILRLDAIKGRFSGYVLPGQTLTLVGYKTTVAGEQPFTVLNSSGRMVMKNGLFRFRRDFVP